MEENKKVLIVEDEVLIADALQKKLEKSGYIILRSSDGEDGLSKALEFHPDLILLDIILPKMDGMTLLTKLREDSWGKNARVIILTNLDTDEEYEKSRKKGVNDFLVKTNWTLDDVIKKIHERLSKP